MSILLHHDNYDYYWDLYVYGHSFWTTDVGFLKLGDFGFAIAHLLGYFCTEFY